MATKSVVVLGAGVIGLSTALKIQEQEGYKVTIVAEILPTDPLSPKYTSQWAGAQHVGFSDVEDPRHALEEETFKEMWDMSVEGGEIESLLLRLQQTEFFGDVRSNPSPLGHMPEFRKLDKDELIEGAVDGETFQALTLDTPHYLNWLLAKFLSRGGRIVRGSVQHIAQLAESGVTPFLEGGEGKTLENPTPPDAIIVCAGLAARHLGGVEDEGVYPIRGQTVLVDLPWIWFGRTFSNLHPKTWTYIIPRKSGHVILGGTIEENDWYPKPRPATTRSILERNLKICPDLIPAHLRKDPSGPPTIEDILPYVIQENCGFRPGRKGGIRLEAGEIKASPTSDKTVPVIYNYGHAGFGFIASFGCARVVVELLQKALAKDA